MSTTTFADQSLKDAKRPAHFEVGESRALVTILSYNVQGLPRIAGVTHDRFSEIGDALAALRKQNTQPQIVLLQEAFVGATLSINHTAGYKYQVNGPTALSRDEHGRLTLKALSGGIRVLSDFPIHKAGNVVFDHKLCASWDCFANKGAQIVRVEIPGIPFSFPILNTHTQAGAEYDKVRVEQFDILSRFMEKHVPATEPILAIGDFNTWPSQNSYQHWQSREKMGSVTEDCLSGRVRCVTTIRQNKGLDFSPDHHFYRSGQIDGYHVDIRPVFAEHLFYEPVKGRTLSDHWGYSVTYEITWTELGARATVTAGN